MKVAITGGTGFIGKHLAMYCISHGHEVRILSRKPNIKWPLDSVRWFTGDLNEPSCLLPFVDGVDILYHCAGQLTETDLMLSLHVDGTQNLIEAASHRIGHWVQLSSVGVYGAVSEGVINEESPINPVGVYEVTKAESDQIVLNAASQGSFSCSILRPSNVFGADMKNQSLFSMISMIDRGLFFFIGKPGASANYIHVDNVVDGLIRCGTISAAKGRIYNLSDHCTMEAFVSLISDALGCNCPRIHLPEMPLRWASKLAGVIPGFPLTHSRVNALVNRSTYQTDRIEAELHYVHVMSMENGLKQLVAAYRSKQ